MGFGVMLVWLVSGFSIRFDRIEGVGFERVKLLDLSTVGTCVPPPNSETDSSSGSTCQLSVLSTSEALMHVDLEHTSSRPTMLLTIRI